MELKATFSSVFLLSLFLLVSTIDGRKDLGKYWETTMKGEPMPEAIKNLINVGVKEYDAEKSFVKIFDPSPNFFPYHYHDYLHPNELKSVEKDCDSHHDGPKENKIHMDDFEPRPNLSIYGD